MTTTTAHAGGHAGGYGSATETTTRKTNALLACGVIAGPLFLLVVLIQELTRAGFDPRRHPLSLLSLGDLGWIQITNFVVAGALALASAFGLRGVLRGGRAGTWGPRLIGVYGVGLIWGGVFVADPYDGFPAGTPLGSPEQLSWHGLLHAIAPTAAGLALIAACFVFARRFAGLQQRGWAATCVAVAVANIGFNIASFATTDYRLMLAGGGIMWCWAAAVTAHVLTSSRSS